MTKTEQQVQQVEERYVAGLNCEKHKLSLGKSMEDLLDLGVKYLGKSNWKLPPGARIDYIGYDEEDESDDWVISVDGEKYHVWSCVEYVPVSYKK